MPFDGSGNYVTLGAPDFPAASGATIVSTYYNNVINDLATALSLCITRDGQGKPSAAIDWNAKNLSNVATLTAVSITPVGAGTLTVGAFTVAAGVAGKPGMQFASGTLSTTPVASALEYDGNMVQLVQGPALRGALKSEAFIRQSATYTLANSTPAQKLFNSSANGAVTLPIGSYHFEGLLYLKATAASTAIPTILLAGTATKTGLVVLIHSISTGSTVQQVYTENPATGIAAQSFGGGTVQIIRITGHLVVTVAGTVIPQISLSSTSGGPLINQIGSNLRFWPVGTASTIGPWS